MKTRYLALAVALFMTVPASAQTPGSAPLTFSVGPQVSTLGFGIGASARLSGLFGISAEYNLIPLSDIERNGFDNRILIEPALQGGLLMVTIHPTGRKLTLAGGVQLGGANANMMLALAPGSNATVDIGEGTYPADQIGTLNGSVTYGSTVQPTFLIGWTGKGLNLAVGAALATPEVELSATGPLNSDANFRADVQREIDSFDDAAGDIPVFPYVRLGWQFGL